MPNRKLIKTGRPPISVAVLSGLCMSLATKPAFLALIIHHLVKSSDEKKVMVKQAMGRMSIEEGVVWSYLKICEKFIYKHHHDALISRSRLCSFLY